MHMSLPRYTLYPVIQEPCWLPGVLWEPWWGSPLESCQHGWGSLVLDDFGGGGIKLAGSEGTAQEGTAVS